MGTGDNRAELAVAQSIVGRGDFTVGPSQSSVFVPLVYNADGLPYSSYGIGASLILLPAALVGNLADCPGQPGGCPDSVQQATDFAASFICGVFAALAVTALFLFALELGARIGPAVALALLFGFSTIEWPYAHDAYDIGPTSFFILLALFALHRGILRKQPAWLLASGAALGIADLVRLQSAVLLPVFGIYLLVAIRRETWRKAGVHVAAWVAPIATAFAVTGLYNLSRFGSVLDGGQAHGAPISFSTPLVTGLAGQLLSPGKSMFLFSPALLIGLVALPTFIRKHRGLGLAILGAVAINLAFYGIYFEWAGDYAWGPRYTVLVTALLMLPAIELLSRWHRLHLLARAGIIAAAVTGVGVQFLGVSIDYLHQMLLERFQGIDPRTYWAFPYSAIWRHAGAFWGVLNGNAGYPSDQIPMDISLGLPQFTTFDFWWVYAWFNGTNPILIVAIVGVAVLLMVGLADKLWLAVFGGHSIWHRHRRRNQGPPA
jgi:hypothetical protein